MVAGTSEVAGTSVAPRMLPPRAPQVSTSRRKSCPAGQSTGRPDRAGRVVPIYLDARDADDVDATGSEPLVDPESWDSLPDWIALPDERGRGKQFPPLKRDALFRDNARPCLLPYVPSDAATHRGAVIVCPGGNYEFLHPREGSPVARWIAKQLGVAAFVLRYRLLPSHTLADAQCDLRRAVIEARRWAGGGPVVAVGFSAGGHLAASTCAEALGRIDDTGAAACRPDAQVLVYPCTDPTGWADDDMCGFWRVDTASAAARSLQEGREKLRAGDAFACPPPTFIVGSIDDDLCPVAAECDPYVAAARAAGASMRYMRGAYGPHGFGLQPFWTKPCERWLRDLGVGEPCSPQPQPAATVDDSASAGDSAPDDSALHGQLVSTDCSAHVLPSFAQLSVREDHQAQDSAYIVFDTETHGKNPQLLVQIAFIAFDRDDQTIFTSSTLVKLPAGRAIAPAAMQIHRICDEDLARDGIDASDALATFFAWAHAADRVVAHNFNFDFDAVRSTCEAHGLQFDAAELREKSVCTMRASTAHVGLLNRSGRPKWPRNSELYAFLYETEPDEGQLHDALVDCRVTAANFKGGRARGWW